MMIALSNLFSDENVNINIRSQIKQSFVTSVLYLHLLSCLKNIKWKMNKIYNNFLQDFNLERHNEFIYKNISCSSINIVLPDATYPFCDLLN